MLPARGSRPLTLLVGQTLRDVRLGPATVLTFSGGSQVVIETTVEGEALLGDVVRAASVNERGELTLAFTSGTELLVGVDAETESWAVTGPDGLLTVCLAGGELAAWGDG